MRNKGIPNVHGAGIGDQLVQIQVFVPKNLNAEDKQKITDLLELDSLEPTKQGHKNIFEKFKDALNF